MEIFINFMMLFWGRHIVMNVLNILKMKLCVMNAEMRISMDVMMNIKVMWLDMVIWLMMRVMNVEMMASMVNILERMINWMSRMHLVIMFSWCYLIRETDVQMMILPGIVRVMSEWLWMIML